MRSILLSAFLVPAITSVRAFAAPPMPPAAPPVKKEEPKLDIKIHEPEPGDDADDDDAKSPEKTGPEKSAPPPVGEEAKAPKPAEPKPAEPVKDEPRAVGGEDDELRPPPESGKPRHDDDADVVSGATPPAGESGESLSRWEEEHPRPDLPDVELGQKPPWERHGELGVDFAFVSRPFSKGLIDSHTHFKPFPQLGFHLHWAIWRWLHVHPYFIWGQHPIDIPAGALATSSPSSISTGATIEAPKVQSFVFGAKLAPTWQINSRWRTWVSVGIGYGRFGFKGMTATEPGGKPFALPDRDGVFVEVPIGIGASVDIVKRWLAISYEASGAPVFGQSGAAHEATQAVGADNKTRDVGGFGAIQASFVQTIGLAIIL